MHSTGMSFNCIFLLHNPQLSIFAYLHCMSMVLIQILLSGYSELNKNSVPGMLLETLIYFSMYQGRKKNITNIWIFCMFRK